MFKKSALARRRKRKGRWLEMSRIAIILLEEIRSAADRALARLKSEESLSGVAVTDVRDLWSAVEKGIQASRSSVPSRESQGSFAHCHHPVQPLQVIGKLCKEGIPVE
jgi:hypothetical protein